MSNEKLTPTQSTRMLNGKSVPFFWGPKHSWWENNGYVKSGNNFYGFSGHHRPLRVDIREFNYLKESHLSGDEVRKGGSVEIYLGEVKIFEDFCRSYQQGHESAIRFIYNMELFWDWFPGDVDSVIGKVVGFKGKPMKVDRVIVSQACVILETLDGKPVGQFPLEEPDSEQDYSTTIKDYIFSPSINWYPVLDKSKE